jgi:DNA-binding CsgD family transcriptional regulator
MGAKYMAVSSSDERDLLVPLVEGIHERPLWDTFLKRLLARTRATRIALVVRFAAAQGIEPLIRQASANPALPEPDFVRFATLGLIPFGAQRRNRVYALEEMLNYDNPEARGAQRKFLSESQVADARFIRAAARGEHDLWLVLLHERIEFGAGDSALLTGIAPYLAASLHSLIELTMLRERLAMAEDTLALLGIGQAALDREGHVVATDRVFASAFEVREGERPALPANAGHALTDACAELVDRAPAARRIVLTGEHELMLRPARQAADALPSAAAAIATLRRPQREDPGSGARAAARLHGLSDREAALAEAISRGVGIVEAGAALHLSQETARNYSKRIYAKTGASGQADLVRLLLSGLVPVA